MTQFKLLNNIQLTTMTSTSQVFNDSLGVFVATLYSLSCNNVLVTELGPTPLLVDAVNAVV